MSADVPAGRASRSGTLSRSRGIAEGAGLVLLWLGLWILGLLAEQVTHASVWFPPSALTFATLVIVGLRAVVPLLIACILVTFFSVAHYGIELDFAKTLMAGIGFGVAHVGVYLVGATVLQRDARRHHHSLPRIIIAFIFIAVVTSALATVAVLSSLLLTHMMPIQALQDAWLAFWTGDMVALIVLAPLIAAMLMRFAARTVFWIAPLETLASGHLTLPFVIKLCTSLTLVSASMLFAWKVGTVESAFVVFFCIIPQMWITHTERPLRTAISIALSSLCIVLWLSVLNLSETVFVYQFAIAIIATTAYVGMAIPVLVSDNELLRRRIMSDTLTGAASRDFLVQQANLEIGRSDRTGRPLSLLVIDIDHFKSINDRFGHATGDRILVNCSKILSRTLRSTDILARFGGDEFVALLPDTDVAAAVNIADRLQQQVRTASVEDEHLSVSIGAAELRAGEEFNSLFDRADRALYRAKRAGRDRVFPEAGDDERHTSRPTDDYT